MSESKSAAVDIDALFRPNLEEREVEIEGVGTFRIRAMSRAELMALRGKGLDLAQIEQHMIATALVEPKLTVAQVRRWQEAAPAGVIEPLGDEIMRLSKMDKTAAKEVAKNFRDEP